ncbi:hypothetical protein CDD83_7967 [Cordyceps sp. RAO-2017]|nr:hypothetical protein CDD83_7967 [Cordyceps sp. RAO-2017]
MSRESSSAAQRRWLAVVGQGPLGGPTQSTALGAAPAPQRPGESTGRWRGFFGPDRAGLADEAGQGWRGGDGELLSVRRLAKKEERGWKKEREEKRVRA